MTCASEKTSALFRFASHAPGCKTIRIEAVAVVRSANATKLRAPADVAPMTLQKQVTRAASLTNASSWIPTWSQRKTRLMFSRCGRQQKTDATILHSKYSCFRHCHERRHFKQHGLCSGLRDLYLRLHLRQAMPFSSVERVIAKTRRGYLIHWKGCSMWECSFEPRRNLNRDCLRSFEESWPPDSRRLQHAADILFYEVQKKLQRRRHSSGVVVLPFDLDIFRWAFNDSGTKIEGGWLLCEEEDFSKLPLPHGWHISTNKLGEHIRISFPVRVKATLRMMKTSGKEGLSFPLERLRIFMATEGGGTS
ncbi:uncharacterized protein LOC119403043 [Rhipicephalus sanguineus]|uniref:uncharacterized protein LOC119377186 n=1 Tax=Rhipicephalus sanguineus TaxID=34632 RepID=UPI001895A599|nr:uncharacterized protein LOC119377186 [Rhipicephalus sanguineus]XP_037508583.1 uncharacterized protein LOC119385121 [Rhipicephalus sanguineus]XP_037525928.1 uncharacterized protein LOC119403043 [Rhipicephalus sanguineus]